MTQAKRLPGIKSAAEKYLSNPTDKLEVFVITNKITEKMVEKALKILFNDYKVKHGDGVRNLKAYKTHIMGNALFEKEMPEIFEYNKETDIKKSHLLAILEELKVKGYMEKCECEEEEYYRLTESGYERASQNLFQRFITYLNNNLGMAIFISSISLIISIVSIIISLWR